MFRLFRRRTLFGGALGLAVLLFGGCLAVTLPAIAGLGAIESSPVLTPSSLPAATCSLVNSIRTCDLWAKPGTISLPGAASVNIWGYTDDPNSPAQMPGPVLIVNEGETVNINLHNTLSEASSLSLPGQPMVPDRTGATAGSPANPTTKTYTFTAAKPGTSLYQAGLTADGPRQVAMGLFGALIVRPAAAGSAYDNSTSGYDDETVQVFSELDPALNGNPAAFDMRKYAPKYWLINGQSYPNTSAVPVGAGHKVLLRYINAGSFDHSIGSLGLRSQVIGTDGKPLTYPYGIVAETLTAGQTMDLITTIPATAPAGTKYPLYNGANHLDNAGMLSGGSVAFGGMLTFLQVDGQSGPPADTTGPATSGVLLNPAITNGASDIALSATFNDTSNGNSSIADAEYFIDTPGTPGSGIHFTGIPGNTVSVTVSATIPASQVAALSGGTHLVLVHGQDSANNWGQFQSQPLYLDKLGPKTSGSLLNNPVNGSAAVSIRGTGDDSTTGNSQVTAAEYFIDSQGSNGSGQPLNITAPGPVVELTGSIPVTALTGLPEGAHTVYIHSKDAFDQWGGSASLSFKLDRTAPGVTSALVAPNPNNGTLLFDPNSPSIRISATATDPVSGGISTNIKAVEGFLDTTGAPGTGIVLIPTDGAFNSASENAYALVPISTIQTLTAGSHTFSFRAQDAAGNWGSFTTTQLVVDKTGPAVSNLAATPSPTNGAATATLTGTVSDPVNGSGVSQAPGSNVTGAEWFEGADPGKGSATPFSATDGSFNSSSEGIKATINTTAMSIGSHTLSVRAKDAAGNWGGVVTATLNVTMFADGFESGNFSAWTSTTGAKLSVTSAAALNGTSYGMAVTTNNNSPNYVTDGTPNNEAAYNARFYFNPNGATIASNATVDLLNLMNTGGTTTIARVQWRRSNNNNQIRIVVRGNNGVDNPTNANTGWVTITNAAHFIEISWRSAANSTASLYIDGGQAKQTVPGINTANFKVDAVRLGILSGSITGTVYFDAFKSSKGTTIGA